MGRRVASNIRGRSVNEVENSVFDTRKRPELPRGLPKDIRARARKIFDCNMHLWSEDQVDAVVRLARLRARLDNIEDKLTEAGEVVTDRHGIESPNPLLKSLSSMASTVLALERSLGIAFLTRKNNLTDREMAQPKKASKPTAGAPKLRLA